MQNTPASLPEQPPQLDPRQELTVARDRALRNEILRGATDVIALHERDARALDTTLTLAGLVQLRLDDHDRATLLAAQLAAAPAASLPAALRRALQLDALGGDPGVLPEAVAAERARLNALPRRDGSTTALTALLANDQLTLRARLGAWNRYAGAAFERLRAAEQTLRASESEGFEPSMDDGAMEQLDESQIEMRVLPYRGGYFREAVHTEYDTATNAWTTEGRTLVPIVEDEGREDGRERRTYTFSGVFRGAQALPLPAGAEPDPASLSLVSAQLVRDEKGVVSIVPRVSDMESEQAPFELQFSVDPMLRDDTAPTFDEGTAFAAGRFSEDAGTLLATLRTERLTPLAAARQVRAFVTSTLTYSVDKAKSDAYRAAGPDYFRAIADGGEADCDVANTYFLALVRELGIPCRLVTGYHVRKDPRFPFAALAGTKHAWSEVWDGEAWHRMDATPPKNDDEQGGGGGDNEQREGQLPPEGIDDVENDDFEELPPIDAAELQKLVDELQQPVEQSPEARIAELFARREGVSLAEIQAYRTEIAAIAATRNPDTGKTIAEEYRALYDRFVKVRWRSRERFRGPVLQSEGEELLDPVMAYIDIQSGDADPMGFKEMARERVPEHIVTDIEDDQLLDLTASMEQSAGRSTLLAEQRKMALVHLEELARLNEQLNDVAVRTHLTAPLGVRTSVMGFRGNRLINLKTMDDELTEKLRIEVARELQKTEAGRGNLLAALQQYRASIPPATVSRLKDRSLTKILTIFSDGNVYCPLCGKESCNHSIDANERRKIVEEIAALRTLGVVVHGIGFTPQSKVIAALAAPDSVIIPDATRAVVARHQLILKSLKEV